MSDLWLDDEGNKKKMASHQRRIGRKKLKAALPKFLDIREKFLVASSFGDILYISEITSKSCKGLGELAAYDIALRIANSRNISPYAVYLHSGAAEGAKNLGLVGKSIRKTNLVKIYPELLILSEASIENFFCVFKDHLTKFKRSPPPK